MKVLCWVKEPSLHFLRSYQGGADGILGWVEKGCEGHRWVPDIPVVYLVLANTMAGRLIPRNGTTLEHPQGHLGEGSKLHCVRVGNKNRCFNGPGER